jgi:prolyl 4-hydroxylase
MSDELEDWFRLAMAVPGCTQHHLAAAMQQDGIAEPQAHLMAAAAQIRYGATPLSEIATSSGLLDALLALRRYAPSARRAAHQQADAEAAGRSRDLLDHLPNRMSIGCRDGITVQCVCHSPRSALLGSFLDVAECDALIALARGRLRRSEVTDSMTAHARVDPGLRASESVFLSPEEGPIVAAIEARAARLLGCPVSHLEPLSVNRYGKGGEFREHVDYLEESSTDTRVFGEAGDRVATLVLYLNEVASGGATVFPIAGLELRPQRGSALWFSYCDGADGFDPASLHAGASIARGEKWIATVWAHARRVRPRRGA